MELQQPVSNQTENGKGRKIAGVIIALIITVIALGIIFAIGMATGIDGSKEAGTFFVKWSLLIIVIALVLVALVLRGIGGFKTSNTVRIIVYSLATIIIAFLLLSYLSSIKQF